MSFEEQFPSLMKTQMGIQFKGTKGGLDLQKYCLDKERVKAKWFKFRDKIEKAHILTPETYKEFDNFQKKVWGLQ